MLERAPAKINLYLHVLGRRPDGYHELDSLTVFAGAADTLHAEPAENLSLEIIGPFADRLAGESNNLVLRAAHALAASCGVPATGRLTLEKHLPVASGIGGGSADAAAALRLLTRLWGVTIAGRDLARLAEKLGADVPVCLASQPARLRGTGEILDPAPALPPFGLALVNPGIPVATEKVFRTRTGPWSEAAKLPPSWPTAAAMAADLAHLRNDLAAPAIALQPVIETVLAALRAQPGCLWAAMSGSGATCYGLFENPAEAAAIRLPPHWWRWPA